MKKAVYIAVGFIIGCMFTDCIHSKETKPTVKSGTDYGKLIFAIAERPSSCPMCGFEFTYYYVQEQEEMQRLIDEYLGE